MTTKSSGFSLVELLVVIAIIGVLSAVGTLTYQGYISGTKKKTAKKCYDADSFRTNRILF